jgi:ABC-2 type transport system ATP-binding protein
MSDGVLRLHGPLAAVRGDRSLEDVFVQVVGGRTATGSELAWL